MIVRYLGLQEYTSCWQRMQQFTDTRGPETPDELWCLEHQPVFTQGQAGKAEHLLAPGDIPVVQVDRGGQVTYHAPGQLIIYVLLDLKRHKLGVRQLVSILEQSIVDFLNRFGVSAYPKKSAPGVYVDEQKIASIGLRIRKGCSFHGLALNVDTDLAPFNRINPCGYAGLSMINCSDRSIDLTCEQSAHQIVNLLSQHLNITEITEREAFNDR